MKIKFCGAAGQVTGSCYLIETNKRKFLVDCGMFQGNVFDLNYEPFPFNPKDVDFVILTHAHIDHSGRLPMLYKQGFRGTVYATSATCDLVNIMLKDSGHIQEFEAKWRTKKRLRKGLDPVEPLYTVEDALVVNDYLYRASYNKWVTIDKNIEFMFKDAGHLLGSAIVVIKIKENKRENIITFSGDLGNIDIPIIKNYEYIDYTDYLVIESTYGNRFHESRAEEAKSLYDIIINTVKAGGNVIIPAFSVGRTQEVLYILNQYIDIEKKEELKNIEFYLDSPLAREALEIFEKHKECYDEEALNLLSKDIDVLHFDNLYIVQTAEESQALNEKQGVVIISASGMCEAGRIKHHLKHNIWKKNTSIIFVGYQAEGTLGRRILDGEKRVKIFGEEMVVNANIYSIPSLSGHADLGGLLNWVKNIKNGVFKKIFVTHGEEEASKNLKEELERFVQCKVEIPKLYDEFIID
ncbi:MBL fold metallo-hydrolase [Caloramator proteoclasticus]|uniref:Metallo-beta-lactamase family protein n=1 Tax=Caloramator proteoclasticus DSM 10124 TaxID=1121262 RepID=A0A1M4U624_9CLOT|nr:MBL fold metallo-hydrolase [Caloramator proteoclasticus]SHE52096.1 metallo-beta-lactamase family protein [Caloramator proteoclasticus DSM 10124]